LLAQQLNSLLRSYAVCSAAVIVAQQQHCLVSNKAICLEAELFTQ
jgi:hypothetical protein